MPAWIREFELRCPRCGTVIEVSVLVTRQNESVARHSLNELLADYGWLPTDGGAYCRQHAEWVRENMWHPSYRWRPRG